jgi:hypothetical protein
MTQRHEDTLREERRTDEPAQRHSQARGVLEGEEYEGATQAHWQWWEHWKGGFSPTLAHRRRHPHPLVIACTALKGGTGDVCV